MALVLSALLHRGRQGVLAIALSLALVGVGLGAFGIDRLQDRWPKLRLIHLPVHASWLNQVEIYFSVVQRKVISPNDFHTLDEVETRLLDFQQYYEQIATPFEWKFTKDDLNALLERIAAHEDAALMPAA